MLFSNLDSFLSTSMVSLAISSPVSILKAMWQALTKNAKIHRFLAVAWVWLPSRHFWRYNCPRIPQLRGAVQLSLPRPRAPGPNQQPAALSSPWSFSEHFGCTLMKLTFSCSFTVPVINQGALNRLPQNRQWSPTPVYHCRMSLTLTVYILSTL